MLRPMRVFAGHRALSSAPLFGALLVVISGAAISQAHAEEISTALRTWTSQAGTTIRAELIQVTDGVVELRREDGRELKVPVAKLSDADQQFLANRDKPKPSRRRSALSREMVQRLKKATVYVKVPPKENKVLNDKSNAPADETKATGSGFVAHIDGRYTYIVTCAHVITDEDKRVDEVKLVFNSGEESEKQFSGKVVAVDDPCDLAVVRVDAKLDVQPLPLTSTESLYETMPLYVLGFPFGQLLSSDEGNPSITVSQSNLSSIRKSPYGKTIAVQLDGDINPGNSGGPTVDADGALIGVNVAKVIGAQIGLAVPASSVRAIFEGHRLGALLIARNVGGPVRKPAASSSAGSDKSLSSDEPKKSGAGAFKVGGEIPDPLGRVKKVKLLLHSDKSLLTSMRPSDEGKWGAIPSPLTSVEFPVVDGKFLGEMDIPGFSANQSYVLQAQFLHKNNGTWFDEPTEIKFEQKVEIVVVKVSPVDRPPPRYILDPRVPTVPSPYGPRVPVPGYRPYRPYPPTPGRGPLVPRPTYGGRRRP